MPLTLDPDATFDFVLESDQREDVPRENWPTFVFRHLPIRDMRVMETLAETIGKDASGGARTGAETLDALCALVTERLVGWRNMVRRSADPAREDQIIPYSPDELDSLVTMPEAWLLYHGILNGGMPTVDDIKKFVSPSSSSTDSSANTVEDQPNI